MRPVKVMLVVMTDGLHMRAAIAFVRGEVAGGTAVAIKTWPVYPDNDHGLKGRLWNTGNSGSGSTCKDTV